MSEFEKEVIKEAKKSKFIAKYYADGFTASDIGLNIKLGIATHNFPWLEFAKNWHSDEEFQGLKEQNEDQAESILLMLDEIKSLKSQFQQQALPVVPELTQKQADTLNDYKNGSSSLVNYLSTEIKKGDYDYFARAWLCGYTVEKPQLFYLKHIDFCKTDKHYDWFTIKFSDGALNHLRVEKGEKPSTIDCKFTQQEIDSMQTGSYEKIEV